MLADPTSARLEFSRTEGRHQLAAVVYRTVALGVALVGERRVFAVVGRVALFAHRLAFESAIRLLGESFTNATMPLDDAMLEEVVDAESTVVDLGCGLGRYSRRLAPMARLVVGIDYDAESLDVARRRTAAPNVEYRLGDVRDLDGVFDVGVLVHTLEHIDDAVALLRALRGRVRTLAIEVPDFESDPVNLARLSVGATFASDRDHVREYTEATLRATLAEADWRVDAVRKRGGAIAVIASCAS
ncbi:MAG: class I SAM-dependent methyltransferase [Acidimicrobiia bacterium]|nr:class I SAM-dependent methyltransferase [Acidimicrobiia bacterium]